MQVSIARQLGLQPTTVGNFFMNARRRLHDKWDSNDYDPTADPDGGGVLIAHKHDANANDASALIVGSGGGEFLDPHQLAHHQHQVHHHHPHQGGLVVDTLGAGGGMGVHDIHQQYEEHTAPTMSHHHHSEERPTANGESSNSSIADAHNNPTKSTTSNATPGDEQDDPGFALEAISQVIGDQSEHVPQEQQQQQQQQPNGSDAAAAVVVTATTTTPTCVYSLTSLWWMFTNKPTCLTAIMSVQFSHT